MEIPYNRRSAKSFHLAPLGFALTVNNLYIFLVQFIVKLIEVKCIILVHFIKNRDDVEAALSSA